MGGLHEGQQPSPPLKDNEHFFLALLYPLSILFTLALGRVF
jgi:hypothetical protein